MKTIILLTISGFLTFISFSQIPDTTVPFSLEGQLKIDKGIAFSAPTIRLRYFHSQNFATRYSINIAQSGNTSFHYQFSDLSGDVGTEKNRAMTATLNIGCEYHLKGTDKFSPYIGGDLFYGIGALSKNRVNYDGSNWTINYNSTNKSNYTNIGVNLVAGSDYYFTKNLYLGIEFGLIWKTTFYHEGIETITIDNQSAVSKTPKSSLTTIGNNSISSLRFGWRF
jgi:outer membrane protein W